MATPPHKPTGDVRNEIGNESGDARPMWPVFLWTVGGFVFGVVINVLIEAAELVISGGDLIGWSGTYRHSWSWRLLPYGTAVLGALVGFARKSRGTRNPYKPLAFAVFAVIGVAVAVLFFTIVVAAGEETFEATTELDANTEAVWASDYAGRRLLSDSAWIWCTDNRESVSVVSVDLDLGPVDSPYKLFRSCAAAAQAMGSIDEIQPGDQLIGTARLAGWSNKDSEILDAGLKVCSLFDNNSMATAIYVAPEIVVDHLIPSIADQTFRRLDGKDDLAAADVVVGAASAVICPEYALEVASFFD